MSRRFGRNQRRKMGEEIARLGRVASDHHRRFVDEMKARSLIELEMMEWARRIDGLLGPESAFARELHFEFVSDSRFDSILQGQPLLMEPRNDQITPHAGPRQVDLARKIIETFMAFAEVHRDHVEGRYRFSIRTTSGRAAVMMDQKTIETLRFHGDSKLIACLVEQLIQPWIKGEL